MKEPQKYKKDEAVMSAKTQASTKKTLVGTVTSDKMNKTILVRIDSKRPHYKYSKLVRKSVKFKVHDEKNSAKIGNMVKIVQTRPLSKDKRWRLVEIVKDVKRGYTP